MRLRVAVAVAVLAWYLSDQLWTPSLTPDLRGRIAIVTGGSRGSGRGFALGLVHAGATVYITGRNLGSLEEACAAAAGPGECIPRVVDSSNDTSLENFFAVVAAETSGRLDILVNNAYSAVGYVGKHQLLGKPFWEQGIGLFDAVHNVGVRSHYKAVLLAIPLLRQAERGLIVNTNSPGCLLYAVAVSYGMGKCAVDKMTADMAIELATEGIDIVSWWSQAPMQTDEILAGSIDGRSWRRGALPGMHSMVDFRELYYTAMAATLLFEGRALAALARDPAQSSHSGLVLQSAQVARKYGVKDERGIRSPSALSLKWHLCAWVPQLREFATLANPATFDSPPTATIAQQFFFGTLPDFDIPVWIFKLLQGVPVTIQWPIP